MSHYRNKKLLRAAKDQPCVLCGSQGNTVACHANRVSLGKGMGIKAPDYFTAWLCQFCHDVVDGRRPSGLYGNSEEMWNLAFIRTVARWFELGIVEVT